MLSIYLIAALAAVLFSLSLQSFRVGVLSLLLTLTACDVAVSLSDTGSYVGPVLVIETIEREAQWFVEELQKAALRGAKYDSCVEDMHTKVWNDESQVLSSKQIHYYCQQQQ